MKQFCTGPRYDNEPFILATVPGWHGLYGHCNVLTPDHQSSITNFGKHDRIVAFCPEGNNGYCRVDHVWNLGTPSDADIVREFKRRNGIKGSWQVVKRDPYDKSTDIYLERII